MYDFGDGCVEVFWFLVVLLSYVVVGDGKQWISCVVVFGMLGSMWDVFVWQFGGEDIDFELELWDVVKNN